MSDNARVLGVAVITASGRPTVPARVRKEMDEEG